MDYVSVGSRWLFISISVKIIKNKFSGFSPDLHIKSKKPFLVEGLLGDSEDGIPTHMKLTPTDFVIFRLKLYFL